MKLFSGCIEKSPHNRRQQQRKKVYEPFVKKHSVLTYFEAIEEINLNWSTFSKSSIDFDMRKIPFTIG